MTATVAGLDVSPPCKQNQSYLGLKICRTLSAKNFCGINFVRMLQELSNVRTSLKTWHQIIKKHFSSTVFISSKNITYRFLLLIHIDTNNIIIAYKSLSFKIYTFNITLVSYSNILNIFWWVEKQALSWTATMSLIVNLGFKKGTNLALMVNFTVPILSHCSFRLQEGMDGKSMVNCVCISTLSWWPWSSIK